MGKPLAAIAVPCRTRASSFDPVADALAVLRRYRPAVVFAGVLLASALYYAFCLYPGIGGQINGGDSAKFQILSHTPIMVHGPGYPLYLLLASAIRALALPVPGWWLISFALSSVPAALANGVAFLIARRLTGSAWFGVAAALLLGGAHLMAVQATEAEVYALNLLFVLSTLYLLIRFVESERPALFAAATIVYAVALGNHLMMVMLLPLFVGLAALYIRILLRPRVIAIVALAIGVGASQYLYLAHVAHDPATAYSEYMPLPPTVSELLAYIAGNKFTDLYGSGLESVDNLERLGDTLHQAHPWISAPVLGLGLLAFLFLLLFRRPSQPHGLLVLYAGALCFLPFTLWYGAWDIEAFHLPVLAPALVAAVAGLGCAAMGRPALRGGLIVLLLLAGSLRAAEEAERLTDRQPRFAAIMPQVEAMAAYAAQIDSRAVLALGYDIRMALMYYQFQGLGPQRPEFSLAFQLPPDIGERPSVVGVVMPGHALEFVRRIAMRRPDLSCRTQRLDLPQHFELAAYEFHCTAAGRTPPGAPPEPEITSFAIAPAAGRQEGQRQLPPPRPVGSAGREAEAVRARPG